MPAKCSRGKIRRKAYTRKDGTYVKSTCVPDKGKPGKTPARKKVLPVPVKGNLTKFGYFDVKNTTAKVRRAALLKAVKAAGYATIVRRVNLVANYNKLSDPKVHRIMRSDMAWMHNKLAPKYSKSALRASKRVSKKRSRKASKTAGKKLVKAGTKDVGGRSRQLYHLSGSSRKFYQYRKKEGGLGRRYL